jgi:anti-sigma B factor antagonist
MTVNTEKTDDTLTVILDGALNKTTCDAVAERIASEMQGIRKLVFDMEKLTFISSAGLRVLVKLRKQVGKRENMELCNVQPDVMNIFSVTGLAEYLNIRQEN